MSSIKNLQKLQHNITKLVNSFLIISVTISILSFLFVIYINKQNSIKEYKQHVSNINDILQFNISSQLAIIINDLNFIKYLRAGEITRDKYYLNIRWLFSNLNHKLIKGIIITQNANHYKVFEYGIKTNLYTELELCYLGDKLNLNLGECDNKILIYFDNKEYLNQLHQLSPKIVAANIKSNNFSFNPFSSSFGGFVSLKHSPLNLALSMNYDNPIFLIVSGILPLLIFLSMYLYSNKYIKLSIRNNLVMPIHYITKGLHNNIKLHKRADLLVELNELIDIVNKYNQTQVNTKLNKLAARVAHDIKSPLAVIELSIAQLLESDHPTREIIKNAIKNSRAIVDNMLLIYSNCNNLISPEFEGTNKAYVFIKDLIQEIIAQKQVEWSKTDCFTINYTVDNFMSCCVFLSSLEFKRHISNLLNNSFEAIRDNLIEITIIVTNLNGLVHIQIKDNGVGIEESLLPIVKAGESLKCGGNGIGLESALAYFKVAGGFCDINSKKNHGTIVDIYLPVSANPKWLTTIVIIQKFLVIVDDDDSMVQYWISRFKNTNLNIITFKSPHQFQEWYKTHDTDSDYTFFIDYDYNAELTGIDLLQILKPHANSYLVTGSYYEPNIQDLVTSLGIQMIPKTFISEVSFIIKQ